MLVVLCYIEYNHKILLIKRNNDPYRGYYALPGGKVEPGEDILNAACRETVEETGLNVFSAEVITYASERVFSAKENCLLFEYNMVLVKLGVDSMGFSESVEGSLYWCCKNEFLLSENVVPTDIDMVKENIFSSIQKSRDYSVVKNIDGRYEISAFKDK